MKTRNLLLFLLLLLGGCQNGCPPLTEIQKSDISKQVLETWEKVIVTIQNADSEGYGQYISPDFMGMISSGVVFGTRSEYMNAVKSWFSERKNVEIPQKSATVTVLSEDLALLNQKSITVVNFLDGRVLSVNHAVSFLIRKESSGWMLAHGHESWTVNQQE